MSEPLHTPDALREVAATFDEPARSWARGLLAVWARELPCGLPEGDLLWDPILAIAPPGVAAACLAALTGPRPPTEGVAATVASAARWGVDLGAGEAVCAAARTHLGAGGAADLHLAHLLADQGALDAAALRAAASCDGADTPAGRAALAALAVRYAAASGSGDRAAADAFGELDAAEIAAALDMLGLGLLPSAPDADPDRAVAHGAALAGADPRKITARGGRRGRARALHAALTEGRTDALACAGRAAIAADAPAPLIAAILAQASWEAVFTEGDPVSDTLDRSAGHRTQTLIAARRAGGPPHAIDRFRTGNLCAGVLAIDAAPEALAEPALAAALGSGSLLALSLAAATLPWSARRLPAALRDPVARGPALTLAVWAPTAEVRDALMALPVPHELGLRASLATALAAMGSPDAAERAMAVEATLPPERAAGVGALIGTLFP